MMKVGQIRHIQATCETSDARNPDTLVGHFLTPAERLGCALRGRLVIEKLRSNPFYYYVLARTRHYDALFAAAAAGDAMFVLNIGCGGDTRAYRWRQQLAVRHTEVVECDQRDAIEQKSRIARSTWRADHVRYLPVDLNDGRWASLVQWLDSVRGRRGFVMMEGVSPYIDRGAFKALLAMLAQVLGPNSEIAYDYKIAGVADQFGHAGDSNGELFRLGADATEVAKFHAGIGLRQIHHELGSALVERLVAAELLRGRSRFHEDALVRCLVSGATA